MPELIAPTARLHSAWLQCHREWGPGLHEDGFGLSPDDEVESPAGFAAWVGRTLSEETASTSSDGCVCRWIVEGDDVLGGIAIRYGVSDFIDWAGHIGFGVRPSARGRGVASWALRRILGQARDLGLDRVLLVCEDDNVASGATIERNGGSLERVAQTEHGRARRYWIDVPR